MDIDKVVTAYLKAFPGEIVPMPAQVGFEEVMQEMLKAIERGKPIPPDFGWYDDLPDGAVA